MRNLFIVILLLGLWQPLSAMPAGANDPMVFVKALSGGIPTDQKMVEAFPAYLRTEKRDGDKTLWQELGPLLSTLHSGEPRIAYRTRNWLVIAVPLRLQDMEQPFFFWFRTEQNENDWRLRGHTNLTLFHNQVETASGIARMSAADLCQLIDTTAKGRASSPPAALSETNCANIKQNIEVFSSDALLTEAINENQKNLNALVTLFRDAHIPKMTILKAPSITSGAAKPPSPTDKEILELFDLARINGFAHITRTESGAFLRVQPENTMFVGLFSTLWFVGNASPEEIDAIVGAWCLDDLEGITDLGNGWLHVRTGR